MKKIIAVSVIALGLSLSMNVNARLSKADREEYMNCQKVSILSEEYGITWFDQSSWQETLALYHAEMSPLEISKLDKKVERTLQKMRKKYDEVLDDISVLVPAEDHSHIIYVGLVGAEKSLAAFYECQ
jgi:hypothetical protein